VQSLRWAVRVYGEYRKDSCVLFGASNGPQSVANLRPWRQIRLLSANTAPARHLPRPLHPARPQRNHYICLKIRRLQVRDNDHEPVRRALCHLTDAADQGLITAEPLHKDDKSSAKISPPKPLNLTSLPSSVRPKPFERSAAGNHVCYLP